MATTRIADLIEIAEYITGVPASEIAGPDRTDRVCRVRNAVAVVAHELGRSYPQLGAALHRDHTTIMSGVARAKKLAGREHEYADLIQEIRDEAAAFQPFAGIRPMFLEAFGNKDDGHRFHEGISEGSAMLLAALNS